jgi:hypothetical protein
LLPSTGGIISHVIASNCTTGLGAGDDWRIDNCVVHDNTGDGIAANLGCTITYCSARKNAGNGFNISGNSAMLGCSATLNTGFGIEIGAGSTITDCAAVGSEKVVVRAIGPSLIPFGITNALPDPSLELHDSNGNTIAVNDNWKDGDQAAEIQASGLAPGNDLESAILKVLPAGGYTAIVRGNANATGVGLVEAYNLP